jgi:DNA-binding NtrC family response regulator
MPVNMQIKLLRVLDGYGYTPVGSTKVKNSRFRLICATNRKLHPLIAAGVMRLDFYHRINQLNITMPPLRERAGDMEILITTFAERFYHDNRLTPPQSHPLIPEEAMRRFKAHNWPGNVRELHHAVIKYLSMGEIDFPARLPGEDNALSGQPPAPLAIPDEPARPAPDSFNEFERAKLLALLNGCGWNLEIAAAALGKSKRTLQRKIAKYGLK